MQARVAQARVFPILRIITPVGFFCWRLLSVPCRSSYRPSGASPLPLPPPRRVLRRLQRLLLLPRPRPGRRPPASAVKPAVKMPQLLLLPPPLPWYGSTSARGYRERSASSRDARPLSGSATFVGRVGRQEEGSGQAHARVAALAPGPSPVRSLGPSLP